MEQNKVLEKLERSWPELFADYKMLSSTKQVLYLNHQGYASLKDLVAHIIAWWEFAMQVIEVKKHDTEYFFPDINVDEFNARAVEEAKDLSEEQVLQQFEDTRLKFTEYVRLLTEDQIKQPNIAKQLEIDLFGHLLEHAIKKT